jgi:hypothetical protein
MRQAELAAAQYQLSSLSSPCFSLTLVSDYGLWSKFQEKITNALASSFIDGQPHLALIPQICRETKQVRYKEVEAGKKGNTAWIAGKFQSFLASLSMLYPLPPPPPPMVSENEG